MVKRLLNSLLNVMNWVRFEITKERWSNSMEREIETYRRIEGIGEPLPTPRKYKRKRK